MDWVGNLDIKFNEINLDKDEWNGYWIGYFITKSWLRVFSNKMMSVSVLNLEFKSKKKSFTLAPIVIL